MFKTIIELLFGIVIIALIIAIVIGITFIEGFIFCLGIISAAKVLGVLI